MKALEYICFKSLKVHSEYIFEFLSFSESYLAYLLPFQDKTNQKTVEKCFYYFSRNK